jgi:hypothetical protein
VHRAVRHDVRHDRVFKTGGLTRAQIDAGATFAQPIACLKAGTSIEQARTELAAFSSSYKARHPTNIDANNISEPRPFVAALVSGFQPTQRRRFAQAMSSTHPTAPSSVYMTGGARTPYGVAGRPLPPLSQRPIVGLNIVSDGYR